MDKRDFVTKNKVTKNSEIENTVFGTLNGKKDYYNILDFKTFNGLSLIEYIISNEKEKNALKTNISTLGEIIKEQDKRIAKLEKKVSEFL